jgi:Holliday junction resolvase-like predicted endonuclease
LPIVLTSNEKILSGHSWKDLEGEQYHFPNQYRNLITPNTRFVYYRGVHRVSGGPGQMEYFGVGSIGEVWLDPDTADEDRVRQNWYCSIENYIPFPEPVPAKIGEATIETVNHPQNHWRRAVRNLTQEQYLAILERARIKDAVQRPYIKRQQLANSLDAESKPALGKVSKLKSTKGPNSAVGGQGRYSKQSKTTGDAGEKAVIKYLQSYGQGISDIRWVADEGKTPGWDIEYRDANGESIKVEVKSSQSKTITSVELTVNEWRAAEEHRSKYRLALVGSCLSLEPVIEFVDDPFGMAEEGGVSIRSTRFELSW